MNIFFKIFILIIFKSYVCGQLYSLNSIIFDNYLHKLSKINNLELDKDVNNINLNSNNLSECKYKLLNYTVKFNPLDASNPFSNTGNGINDLGKYDTCLRGDQDGLGNLTGNYAYIVYLSFPKLSIYPNSYVGSCLPIECYNSEGFEFTKERFSKSTILMYNDGNIIDTKKENNKYKLLSYLDVIILVIISLFVLLTIIAYILIDNVYLKNKLFTNNHNTQLNNKLVQNVDDKTLNKYCDTSDLNFENNKQINLNKSYQTMRIIKENKTSNLYVIIISDNNKINNDTNTTFFDISINNNNMLNSNSSNNDSSYPDNELNIKSIKWKILNSINIIDNIKGIFVYEETFKNNKIKVLEGLKALTIILALFYLTADNLLNNFILKNKFEVDNDIKSNIIWHFIIGNGALFINALFFINGFLMSYLNTDKLNSLKVLTYKIITNILKLFTLNIIYIAIYLIIVPCLLNGPLSGYLLNKEFDMCIKKDNIYSVMFFYSIFNFKDGNTCMNWTWIVQFEFYYYILGCILCYLINKLKNNNDRSKHLDMLNSNKNIIFAFIVLFIFILLNFSIKSLIVVSNEFNSYSSYFDAMQNNKFVSLYYRNLLCRLEVYIIGIFFGYMYNRYQVYLLIKNNCNEYILDNKKTIDLDTNITNKNYISNDTLYVEEVILAINKKCKINVYELI